MGAPEATVTMSRDHVAISQLIEELGSLRSHLGGTGLDASGERALRRVLSGLSALVSVHFTKEEEVYLPLLDARLTTDEATRLFAAMEQAAQEARSPVR